MKFRLLLIYLLALLPAFYACQQNKPDQTQQVTQATPQKVEEEMPNIQVKDNETGQAPYDKEHFAEYYGEKVNPPAFDFNQDLSKKSLEELRLLRNELYARKGYLFKDATMRGFFNGKKWYQPPFWEENYPIWLSKTEAAFIDKIRTLEQEKLAQNYADKNGRRMPNLANIVNRSQFKNLPAPLLAKLDQNGFAIVPGENIQLFHVYEKNDYELVPSFITTDLYLQLFHMYFDYTLKTVEREKFIPIMTELLEGLYTEAMNTAQTSGDASLKSAAEFNATYYAVPLYFLQGKKKAVPAAYAEMYESEISNIRSAQGNGSALLEDEYFSYSLFKPRGHYTRGEDLQNYFRAMIWVQTAPFCREKEEQLRRISLTAYFLNTKKSAKGKPLAGLFSSVYDVTSFLIGDSDNYSAWDICQIMKKHNLSGSAESAIGSSSLQKISGELQKLNRNVIRPQLEMSCRDKINMIPQRYLMDNEILQTLVDAKKDSKRMLPKGLDVFAAFGDPLAENILMKEYKEDQNWNEYSPRLEKLQKKFTGFNDWNKTVYNKWMHGLNNMLKTETNYPYFMQSTAWQKKNLNTALASWAELKHDAILYAEQPQAAECGGDGPEPPVTVGYVEPNINFWKRCLELIDLTSGNLKKYNLMTEDLEGKTTQLREMAQFLLTASEKELRNEKLSNNEYETIRLLGSTAEYFTISVINPGANMWESITGPDKSVSVVADVYTFNIAPYNTALEVGVGKVNDLYVVVEIGGLLYLAKGAVFSYHEFGQDANDRLTDEQWQEMLEKKKAPGVPQWIKEIIAPVKPVEVQEGYFYSSGC